MKQNKFYFGMTCEAFADLLFILLPIFILLFVNAYKGDCFLTKTFHSPELGMAACIVFGQTLVKLITEFIKIKDELDSGAVSVLCSIVILCLIFSSVILTFVMIFGEKIPILIFNSQIIMFVLSIVMHFLYFGVKQQRAVEQNDVSGEIGK